MKYQNSCGLRWGKLVHQLPEVVNLGYDLHFRRTIARWKYLYEDYTCCSHTLAKAYNVTVVGLKKVV